MDIVKKMVLLIALNLFSLTSWCDTPPTPFSPISPPAVEHELLGRVFLKKSWKNAEITIKDQLGNVVGVTRTNAYGQYKIALVGEKKPPFIVRAVSNNGSEAFGIGNEYVVNVTQLSDFIISKWYGSRRNVANIFKSSDGSIEMPDVNDIQVALGQFFSEINEYIGVANYDVLSDAIGKNVEGVLQSFLIDKDGESIRFKYHRLVEGQFELSYERDESTGSLIISGRNHGWEIDRSSDSKNLTEKYNAPFQAKIDVARVANEPSVSSTVSSAHNWMSQDAQYIKDKRIAEIAIPGTHDSGTAGIGGDTGHTVAATQEKSIPDQLEDGIRYFDLRADEYSGKTCADGSDFYVFHGDGRFRYLSYRFRDVLLGIKNFLDDPSHSKEIIIIDMQQISAGNQGSEAVFFRTVQEILKPYLMDNRIESYQWWKNPIRTIWDYNELNNSHGQVILLASNSWFSPPRSGCLAQMDKNLWLSRDDLLNGFWREKREDIQLIMDDLTAQLSRTAAEKQNRIALFNNYRGFQEKGGLNALNMAPQPSDSTFISWAAKAQFTSETRDYLIKYSDFYVNYKANLTVSGEKSCWSGGLGKLATLTNMHFLVDPTGPWNRVNIIMVDSYSRSNFWTSVGYDNGFRFIKATGYVDFVRYLNQDKNSNSALPDIDPEVLRQCF